MEANSKPAESRSRIAPLRSGEVWRGPKVREEAGAGITELSAKVSALVAFQKAETAKVTELEASLSALEKERKNDLARLKELETWCIAATAWMNSTDTKIARLQESIIDLSS